MVDGETKFLIAEAIGATCLIAGYVWFVGNAETNSTQPKELTGNSDRFSDQQDLSGLIEPNESNNAATNSQKSLKETPPNCDPTPPGYITNFETCAEYKLVQDPRDPNKLCAEKGMYSITNPRTLYGLRRVVGDGDTRAVQIINPYTNEIIGYFASGINASFDTMFKPAMPDAIACLAD